MLKTVESHFRGALLALFTVTALQLHGTSPTTATVVPLAVTTLILVALEWAGENVRGDKDR